MSEAQKSVILEASILSADFGRLGEDAQEAERAGVDVIQIDVMDGVFVPNITFGPGVVKALRPRVSLPLDVHLMIVEPERHLEAFAKAGADRLIVHEEACRDLHLVLTRIHQFGIEAGVTLNPATPLVTLEEVLYMVDLVQIMTVSPGWGGQALIETQFDKIHRLREWLDEGERWVPIAVDGGVDVETAPRLVEAGATVLISGSSVYGGTMSVAENVAALRASVDGVSYRA